MDALILLGIVILLAVLLGLGAASAGTDSRDGFA
jgi:hypothetical protein